MLWHGEFQHTVGATVQTDENNFHNYSVFLDSKRGRRAVVVVNSNAEKSIPIKVQLPGKRQPLLIATPEAPQPRSSNGQALLSPLSAVVFLER